MTDRPDLRRSRPVLAILERLGVLARQLRPRLRTSDLVLIEVRSEADLTDRWPGVGRPLLLVDAGTDPASAGRTIAQVARRFPETWILALTSEEPEDMARLLMVGATRVLPISTPPPRLADSLTRWAKQAGTLRDQRGWHRPITPIQRPWWRDLNAIETTALIRCIADELGDRPDRTADRVVDGL